jgi:CRP-like cAMP-binding protein
MSSTTDRQQPSSSNPNHLLTHLLKRNRILAALSVSESAHFISKLEFVRLTKGKTLYHFGDYVHFAYFPVSGMISILSTTNEGATIEIGMIGSEGVIGIPIVLRIPTAPYDISVQMSGEALRVKADLFRREFDRGGVLQTVVLRYLHSLITNISQSASCNRFHTLEERLCRWLLVSRDCVKSTSLKFTQTDLARMLGASRPAVTKASKALQAAGVIRCRYGQIEILDEKRLQKRSCECYRLIAQAMNHPSVA